MTGNPSQVEPKAKYTPGPWGDPIFDNCGELSKKGPCDGGWTVPNLPLGPHGFYVEGDARLIAAAPLAVDFAQACLMAGTWFEGNPQGALEEIKHRAQAFLAKVLGEPA